MDGYRTDRSRKRFLELTAFEKALLGLIFRVVLESGKAPSVTVLHKTLQTYRLRIVRTLGKLEQKHRLTRKKDTGEITCVYPLSLIPTEHHVIMEGSTELCADSAGSALGIPHMFNKNAEIISRCPVCTETITISITNGNIVSKSHPRIHIWNAAHMKGYSAAAYLQFMNFFCSEEHVDTWKRENPLQLQKGRSGLLEQEYPHIKDYWTRYGRTLGTR